MILALTGSRGAAGRPPPGSPRLPRWLGASGAATSERRLGEARCAWLVGGRFPSLFLRCVSGLLVCGRQISSRDSLRKLCGIAVHMAGDSHLPAVGNVAPRAVSLTRQARDFHFLPLLACATISHDGFRTRTEYPERVRAAAFAGVCFNLVSGVSRDLHVRDSSTV